MFDEGWGGVIAKTVSLDASKVINVTPRYARLRAGSNGAAKKDVIGWQNIELISDRPLETMLKEFKQLKKEYPDRILIASIMEEYNQTAWEELIDRVEQTGVVWSCLHYKREVEDMREKQSTQMEEEERKPLLKIPSKVLARRSDPLVNGLVNGVNWMPLEINFSCPHGMPERRMGVADGQDCKLLDEVCGWINAKATVPVWAKMTPNITDITEFGAIGFELASLVKPARVSLKSGCEGVSAINTIMSVMGIDLKTLHPEPCVEGYSTPGGYSYNAVRPIAFAKVMNIAQMIKSEFNDKDYSLSGIGGIETGYDAAEFILLGSNTVQVCTGVMVHGYGHVKTLCAELQDFMKQHNFSTIEDFRGHSFQYFTTHTVLSTTERESETTPFRIHST
ncbi:unnamed protein product [Microthlaspi erraticum]|uniref:dihydropyrimidine dehydrogenase (NADP(+)) n=1 Tax=Microthlaspi erraticum TaxID=1685480 RepID=A0A6D2KG79_9BRAS|nr:unnamed protein product [Microthlaspi erraticum]